MKRLTGIERHLSSLSESELAQLFTSEAITENAMRGLITNDLSVILHEVAISLMLKESTVVVCV
jgi:hypothetical protein